MRVLEIDHVQLAMPLGRGRQRVREFYENVLGLSVQEKPENLKGRGGDWFTQWLRYGPLALKRTFAQFGKFTLPFG